MIPTVTFIIPCYKLAHLLADCIKSILSQSYRDFEVIVMDDSSPDDTPEVVASFHDPRITHIRNEPNLGHLRNYNKGISLARGKYIWLISADDYLRHPRILERYVGVLESNPRVGYTVCAGVSVVNGQEKGIINYSLYSERDCVVNGQVFLRSLLKGNFVLAASGLVRRECYEKLGAFPLSAGMAWAGDWYLWCLFALHYDVAFFAEPMVAYREHVGSMTKILEQHASEVFIKDDFAIPLMIKLKADEAGLKTVSRWCMGALAYEYTVAMNREKLCLSRKAFEESVCRQQLTSKERAWIRARVYAAVGDSQFWHGRLRGARVYYLASRRQAPLWLNIYIKLLLLASGKWGQFVRQGALILLHRRKLTRPSTALHLQLGEQASKRAQHGNLS